MATDETGVEVVDSLAAEASEVAVAIARDYASIRTTLEALQLRLTSSLTGLTDDERKRLDGLQRARLLAENASAIGATWRVRSLRTLCATSSRGLSAKRSVEWQQRCKC
ncbi:MAG: hypothetical protein M5T61_16960 [Acidimicrobiia bacterium]|nr:hypothetical protein [Acidimicrobiia bacterium]